jgi:hypothetical protein
MSLNIRNLNIEVNNLKNRLVSKDKEKATLQKELDKEDFYKEYKHNIKIWRKQKIDNEQNIKMLILKMKEDNDKFKEKTWLMNS